MRWERAYVIMKKHFGRFIFFGSLSIIRIEKEMPEGNGIKMQLLGKKERFAGLLGEQRAGWMCTGENDEVKGQVPLAEMLA